MLPLLRSVGDRLEEADDVLFELSETASTLRQELRRPQAKPRLIGDSDIQRRVDHEGNVLSMFCGHYGCSLWLDERDAD